MDIHSERIWQRGSAMVIMREARKCFRDMVDRSPIVAHVTLASDHYSIVKRYMKWWQLPLGLWHLWCAARNVNVAFNIATGRFGFFSTNQIDVMATIWRKVPWWAGGNRNYAESAIVFALGPQHREAASMKPHTRALLLISLGEIQWQGGQKWDARGNYSRALKLVPEIMRESSDDREQQAVRVLSAVGFFHYYYGSTLYWEDGGVLLRQALNLARRVSKDQEEKILAECRKRGLQIE